MSALWILHLPKSSVFDLFVLPTNRWWTQADKKHLTCEDVIQWILVWTINFTFMVEKLNELFILFLVIQIIVNQIQLHLIYNVRDINLAKIWNLVIVGTWNQYFAIFYKFEYCIHTCTISISRYCYCANEHFTKHYFPYLHGFQI
jgi:hypothetical protein